MIAMALACKPKLLLADEPTTALDVTLRMQILDLLSSLQRANGMAILLITHDLQLVRRFADRVAVMQGGELVEQGPAQSIFQAASHPYTRKLIASRPVREVIEVHSNRSTRAQTLLSGNGVQVAYRVARPGARGWAGLRRMDFLAVRDASFGLRQGETLAVIGESGSGKSTLVKSVLGLVRHTGRLAIGGQSWEDAERAGGSARKALRRTVQAVFQDPYSSLSPRMTVEDIVGEALQFHEPDIPAAQRRARIREVLAEVGLSEEQFPGLLGRYPHEFSGGQRQRLAIARALIIRPRILVLDEPTSALDVTIQKQVIALLQRLQRDHGLSYFLVTHDMDVVRAMAHEVLVMKDGEIVEAGPVDQVLNAPGHAYTRRLLEASQPSSVFEPVAAAA